MDKRKEIKLNPKAKNGHILSDYEKSQRMKTKTKTKNFKTVKSEISVMANNKKQLVDWINKQLKKGQSMNTFLYTKRVDCGCIHSYKTEHDIPETDVICEHGNQIIIYADNHK